MVKDIDKLKAKLKTMTDSNMWSTHTSVKAFLEELGADFIEDYID